MINATIIADSVSPQGKQLTTFKLRYPKFIRGEFMTHRVVSRNASSSRAIPVAKLIAEVRDDATRAGPVYWGAEQKGMASGEELSDEPFAISGISVMASPLAAAKNAWSSAALSAADHAEAMVRIGVHKSIVNRLLEPFSHINVVATATEWENFFGLRLDRAAQPEMRALAVAMFEARKASTPKLLKPGEWHLPFVDDETFAVIRGERWSAFLPGVSVRGDIAIAIKVSVARCARVSYESFETGRRSTVGEDLALYERLVGAQPLHASPAEHQATPDEARSPDKHDRRIWAKRHEHGNFVGWRQYRKTLPNEALAPLPAEFR